MAKRKTLLKTKLRRKYKQSRTGRGKTISQATDKRLKAKRVGWRRSASGKWYFENRENRSDVNPKKGL